MEKPILFSTEMVRAILDGRKSQTRRVIKVDNPNEWEAVNNCRVSEYGAQVPCYLFRKVATEEKGTHYPHYDVGDILWVRETWNQLPNSKKYIYKAGDRDSKTGEYPHIKWRPSIHMPRAVARLFLEVKDVRVERLQDISEEDAIAEGLEILRNPDGSINYLAPECGDRPSYWEIDPRDAFMWLWDSINAKRGYGWEVNPWVWVIKFERIAA